MVQMRLSEWDWPALRLGKPGIGRQETSALSTIIQI
jgi:hypothetical protein